MRNLGILTGFTIKFQNRNVSRKAHIRNKKFPIIIKCNIIKCCIFILEYTAFYFYVCTWKNPQIQSQSEKFI